MFERLTRWWRGHEPAAPVVFGAAAARASNQPASSELSARILEMCHGQDSIAAGRIHIMSFARVRNRFGAKWSAVGDMVQTVIDRTIQSRLGPADSHYAIDSLLRVLVLPGLGEAEAAIKCAMIMQEIMVGLFGDELSADSGTLELATLGPNGEIIRENMNPARIVLGVLERQVARDQAASRAVEAQADAPDQSGAQEGAARKMRMVAIDSHAGTTSPARQRDESGYQKDRYAASRLLGEAGQSVVDWRRILPPETRSHMAGETPSGESHWATPEPARTAAPPRQLNLPSGETEILFSYQPIWYVPKQYVTTFRLVLKFQGRNAALSVDEVLGDDPATEMELNADFLVLRRALSDIAQMKVTGRRAILSAPIHARSLADKSSRGKILALLDEAPTGLLKLLVTEVIGTTRADCQALPDWVELLNVRCRAVSIELGLDQPLPGWVLRSKPYSVGGDLAHTDWSEGQAIHELPKFVAQAKAAGFSSFLAGAHSKSLAMAGIYAGFEYVAGDSIIPQCALMSDIKPFRLMDLYESNRAPQP